ncbi:MAG: FAD-dependent oxidoreductase, partial [Patescibacteria group bacterium]|nr:FAD-dependent oxidoreductase [Patescibacteria group bacterium]
NPTKKIVLVREKEKSVIPCGIPYIFSRLDSVEKDLMPDKPLEVNKINLLINKITKIDTSNKKVYFENSKQLSYDKLILATGSESTLIPIKGVDKKGVWHIKKDFEYLKKFRKAALNSKNIVIIGGGFIGVELAEELSSIKKLNVSIVEKLEHCLITTFGEKFAILIEEKLKEKGIKIYTNTAVEEITGKDKTEFVKLRNKKISADLVIISVGAKPNINLAKEAGIKLGKYGGIKVNGYMKTNLKDIFAIGDCAETKCLLTKKYIPVMLASTACHEARIAAANLYKKENLIKNDGTLAVFSTLVNGLAIGIAGLNEKRCKDEGFDIVIGKSEALNHHPGTLPNTEKIKVKLIFSRTSDRLLGGQVIGSESIGEMVNILALAIQKETTIYNFDTLQIATHPLLTAAPTI